ncbi:hypothetical protein [Cupriavidus metallidurans]|uniref:hypothetical protein n=1 Tax=Cupriavidus metallidurans TaxID=119219 RepID=UPI000CE04243|nr:hypothetical protein [Cupriavidus metallidurans]AVA36307.1 hypothetical protein C3Z06_23635 [Cupriavidus metallidurans]
MEQEKIVGVTFRVTPRTKRLLEAAAGRERRSLTNMFEVLIEDFCQRNGISDSEPLGVKE